MKDKPDIVKILHEEEKLGKLHSKTQSICEELEMPEETLEEIPGEKNIDIDNAGKNRFDENDAFNVEPIQHDDIANDDSITDLLFESTSDLVAYIDKFGKLLKINKAGLAFSGFSEKELVGKCFWKLPGVFSKSNLPKYFQVIKNVLNGKEIKNFKNTLKDKSGETHIMDFSFCPIKENNKVNYILLTGKDVTELTKTEEKLKESTSHFQTLFNSIADPVVIVDSKGKFLEITDKVEEITGFKKEELLGKNFLRTKIVTGKSKRILLKSLIKRMAGVKIAPYEVEVLTKNGKKLPYELNAAKIVYKGKPADMVVFRDIIERKEVEQAIRHSLEFERTVSVISSRFIGNYDRDDAINRSLSEVGSFTGADRVCLFQLRENGNIMDNTHEWCNEKASPQKDNLQNIPIDTFPWQMEKLRKGEVIHIEDVSKMSSEAHAEKEMLENQDVKSLLVFPLKVGDKLNGFVGLNNVLNNGKWNDDDLAILRVCSEILGNSLGRSQAEEGLVKSERLLSNIVESMSDGVLVLDRDFHYTYWNNAMEKISNIPREEVINEEKVPWEIFPHLAEQGIDKMMQKAMQGEVAQAENVSYRLKDGKTGFTSETFLPLKIPTGEISGIVGVVREVTEQKKARDELEKYQREIEQQNIKLRKLDQLKSDFLNVTSHELRTPIASIKGYVQMLSMGSLGEITEEQEKSLEIVLRNINRLDRLIQDILDLSQLESGTMEFVPEETDLQKMIDEVTETMRSSADIKDIKIGNEVEEQLPHLTIDPERIKQVIINLTNNAIKFSPGGSVINLKVKKEQEDVLFEVQDFGRGIPKDKQERVFETFYQVDSGMKRSFGGAGLSLSISKDIILAHEGKIWVDSAPGEGSTFRFTLPIKPVLDVKDKHKEMINSNVVKD